jgi:RNA polymerase sigma factor (sigma-70 family)
MFRDFRRVHRWEDTDDVLNNALMRLYKALEAAPPESIQSFLRLAAHQIRRELIDLSRHYFGPEGHGANYSSNLPGKSNGGPGRDQEPITTSLDSVKLVIWTEFHEKVEALPDDERAVFDLVWYQDMTQAEAAKVLNVSVPTVKRRWLAARTRLGRYLREESVT